MIMEGIRLPGDLIRGGIAACGNSKMEPGICFKHGQVMHYQTFMG